MGEHQSQTTPGDEDTALPDATRTTGAPGPRVAAKRARRKRTLILAGAVGLTLAVGGTATAAVMAGTASPRGAANATVVPEADPDPLTPAPERKEPDARTAQGAEDAVAGAVQSASVNASDIEEEPDPAPQEETPAGGGGDGGGEPTGEGGTCEASFYGADLAGSATANGETFDPSAMTAAHKTLPFGTMVRVTNPANGASVTVRINDRGPFVPGRCLDLSTAAFDQIIGTGAGIGQVQWQVVS